MPSLKKFLAQAERAIQQGKLEIVDKQMEAKGLELLSQIAFFRASEANR